jgi:excisionase family DNA binding protein
VNTRPQGRLRQRRVRTRRCRRDRCLGGWVDDHRVAEVFELGDQPSGVGFVIASAVPVGAKVVVGLVAFEHPVGRDYSVTEAMALLNLSRTQIYELIRTSRLVTVTQGRRRLVPADSIADYVQLLLAERGGSRHGARDTGLL